MHWNNSQIISTTSLKCYMFLQAGVTTKPLESEAVLIKSLNLNRFVPIVTFQVTAIDCVGKFASLKPLTD